MIRSVEYHDPITILVVEDNDGDFVLIEDYLIEKFNSVTIKQFTHYKSVSNYLLDVEPKNHLILLDLHLPDMSGVELIKTIVDQNPLIPVIVLTGYPDLPLAKKSLELGAYDFLVKEEINPNLLHKSIEFAISRNSYIRQIAHQNEKLKSIAWKQSHIVRSPLARILGIINMMDTLKEDPKNLSFWIDQIKISAIEMDEIVTMTVKETQTLNFIKEK